MTFQAYIQAVKVKTGHSPEQLKALAAKAGIYATDMKAAQLVSWLKQEYEVGHGHSMAVWAVWKDKGWVQAPKTTSK